MEIKKMNEKIKEIAVQAKIQMVSEPRLTEFAEFLIKECINSVNDADIRSFVFTTFDKSQAEACKERCVKSIKQKFDIK
jgi:single-stranded DNA-specific DHH superfamily exonuclease